MQAMLQHGELLLTADEMLFKARCRAATSRVKKRLHLKIKKWIEGNLLVFQMSVVCKQNLLLT